MTPPRPVFVWDGARRRLVWGDQAGVEFWGAADRMALLSRPFAPQDPDTMAMNARLAEVQAGTAAQGLITLHPEGSPVTCEASAAEDGPDGAHLRLEIVGIVSTPDARSLRLSSAFETHPDALALFDEKGALVARNRADRELFRSVDPGFADRFLDAEAGRNAFDIALSEGAHNFSAEAFAGDDNPRVATMLNRAADPVSGGAMVLAATQGVDADVSDDALIASVAHDFRSPLNVIKGFAEFLELAGDDLSPETRNEYLQNIQTAARGLLGVAGRLTASPVAPSRDNIQLAKLAEEEVALFSHAASQRDAKLSLTADPSLVIADQVSTRRILQNLIDNALRHGGVGVEVLVRITPGALEVIDTGGGMTTDRLDAALESGPGLGLRNCVELAKEMGARMEFDADREDGFSARLLFPV